MARILLIDDDSAVRIALRVTLEGLGHTVTEAENGDAGLALLARVNPDLLITDIVMPRKEGIEVLLELRSLKSPVRIIAISGGGRIDATEYLTMAKLLGAAQVLEKPFTREELMRALTASLGNRCTPLSVISAQNPSIQLSPL